MSNLRKTEKELVKELQALRRRVAALERAQAKHKKVENELKQSGERFRALTESASDWVWEVDINGVYTYTSPKVKDLIGYKPEEIIGKTPFDFMPPDEAKRVALLFKDIVKSRKPFAALENTNIHKDRRFVVLETSGVPIVDEDRNLLGYRGIDRDITERKHAEEVLMQSEEEYRSVVENIAIGVSLISPKMEILTLNRQMREWFPEIDVSKKPICYKTFNRPKRNDICPYCPTYKSLKDGQVHEAVTETPTGDKILNYRIISSPVKDKNGKVIAAIEMIENITERKKTEEALKESQERYKTLFEGAAEGILVADVETKRFKYANPAICKMLGYTKEELKQLGVPGIHPKKELQHVTSEFEVQVRGEKILAEAIPCLRKDGMVIYADINSSNILVDGAQCNVGFFTDITKRKHTEEELEKARDQLEIRVQQRTADLGKAIEKLRNEVSERKKAEEKLLTYQKQLRSSASELSLAEERLRRKIATDVHDHLGQNLAISKLKIESLAQSATSPQLIEALKEIRDLIAQAVESTRSLTFELSPPILYELGFGPAVEWLLRQTRQQHGLLT
ncbi:MAG: PAS domain S-box protein, partial [Sedimentisphaerales bacterium]|nr:PAS domain S-box protein [Sedimentisphaerales bacterium]